MLETVNSLPSLLKIVSRQKSLTDRAVRELHKEMDTTHLLFRPDRSLTDGASQEITRRVHALLFKYASMPTISEHEKAEGNLDGFEMGSFGVSAIVGSVFLNTWSEIFPEFKNIVRSVMMKVLEEQAAEGVDPDPTPMIERILPAMKFVIRDQNGIEIIGEQRDKLIYNRVASLLQLMAQVLVNYSVLELDEEEGELEEDGQIAAKLTPLGGRVLVHLQDVEAYIQTVSELYPKLRNEIS